MQVTGNILRIKNKRDNQHRDIEIRVEKVAYITHKKDGRYFQPFELVETLETPLVITGDQLARSENKYLEEGEHEFKVYDKTGETYELNPHKQLLVTTEHDFDTNETILTSVNYSVTVTNAEYKELQSRRPAQKDTFKNKNRQPK